MENFWKRSTLTALRTTPSTAAAHTTPNRAQPFQPPRHTRVMGV